MFVLKRNPIFTYYSRGKNPTYSASAKKNQNDTNTTTYPVQILLSLTHINYVVTTVATLLSTAWETIAYAWVTDLIQPDQYHQYENTTNAFDKDHHTATTTSNSHNIKSSAKADVVMKPLIDEPSWGQFVDVDISSHKPLTKGFLH